MSVLKQLGIIKNMKDYPLLVKYERLIFYNATDILTYFIAKEFELKEV
ncbi:MAG: hypothetical protein U9N55_08205 [candidate division Zixibacteria bacterium]|nr:hypothetical protein [candidate division Zixibacteria bacterium]